MIQINILKYESPFDLFLNKLIKTIESKTIETSDNNIVTEFKTEKM
ncbi:Uncharacterised protein [Mycoplasmopsis edwardii]|uniref:Uncharacterized protein n=1 Tax=Mycoplasmopsis edwardii TaxID=53558 RepID=A0A3B0PLQ2_9BACT|nr:Uncharacterised protein [Mycoplasmopsis edwardii]